MSGLTVDVGLDRGRFELEVATVFDAPVVGLLGHSGSGKSTLLEIVAGLVLPDRGRVLWNGEVLVDRARSLSTPPHRRRIGLVFQDSQLFPHLSVRGNLEYGFKLTPPGERRFGFEAIVDLLALRPLLAAHVKALSGGERQRVALARALLAAPRLLLLDEPLAALDQALKAEILPFLRRVKDELALPMVYVSHSLPEVLQLTDHIAFMRGGRIGGQGALGELLRDRRGAGFLEDLGWDNVLEVTVVGHDRDTLSTHGQCGGLRLAMPFCVQLVPGQKTFIGIAHHEISLSRQPVTDISIQNQFPGTVTALLPGADGVLVKLDAGVPLTADITHKALRQLGLTEGVVVNCLVKGRSISYLRQADRVSYV